MKFQLKLLLCIVIIGIKYLNDLIVSINYLKICTFLLLFVTLHTLSMVPEIKVNVVIKIKGWNYTAMK